MSRYFFIAFLLCLAMVPRFTCYNCVGDAHHGNDDAGADVLAMMIVATMMKVLMMQGDAVTENCGAKATPIP